MNNNKIKVSIVIPTRNEVDYIEKTLRQYEEYKEKYGIETIVSDAFSTDGTLEIAKKYADKVVEAKVGEKQNIAIGRNAGNKVASGTIIFNTDADVMMDNPDHFFTTILDKFKDETLVALNGTLLIYPDERKLSDRIVHAIFNSSIYLSTYMGSFLAKGEFEVVRKSSFDQIGGYDESIVVGEDCDLFYRLAKIGKIKFMKDLVLYHSPRRFRNVGYMKTLLIYGREGFSLFFLGRNWLKDWSPER